MKITPRGKQSPTEVDLTPMIDMTFNLIAFFMLLINFSQSEQNDRVTLPVSELARPTEIPEEFQIIVHITNANTVEVAGNIVNLEALRSHLSSELSHLQISGKKPADAYIVLRGHESIPGGKVQEVIKRFQDIGFERFALRAKENVQ